MPGARVAAESTTVGEGVLRLPPRFMFAGAPVQDAAGLGLAVITCANDGRRAGWVRASHLGSASLVATKNACHFIGLLWTLMNADENFVYIFFFN